MTAPQHVRPPTRKTGPMSTPTIRAIETVYAGHRFRSRLEARWAVFFDRLELPWRYEAQGYDLGDGVKYLPDFELPDLYLRGTRRGVLVEVKGDMDRSSTEKVLRAARDLAPVLLLQEIPAPSRPVPHFHLVQRHDPRDPAPVAIWRVTFVRSPLGWRLLPLGWQAITIRDITDPRVLDTLPARIAGDMTDEHQYLVGSAAPADLAAGFTAARQARFEHGERG